VATLCLAFGPTSGRARADAARFIVVASTTSTQNSGLFDHILPMFEARTGIAVRVVAVGTGAALRLARNGDADVLIVHHRASEEAFVREGFGVARHDLMYNDFLLVGPRDDPAGIGSESDVAAALARIARAGALFASRGDDSGTHKRERALWREAGVDPGQSSGRWYRETGSGMGATLNLAAAMGAYTLADRGTWLSFRNRRQLVVLSEGDPRLRNEYGVILVNPTRHPHVKAEWGQALIDWLLSAEGRPAIAGFRIDGETLFHVE
jgi:tungstate transport system substrate-binding protein